jgi:hypothetical protein
MISVQDENLIPIQQVAELLPRNRGKKVHTATIYRWFGRGLHGVKLETVCVGGRRFTTQAAIQSFFEAVTAHRNGDITATARIDHKRHEQADAELRQAGW